VADGAGLRLGLAGGDVLRAGRGREARRQREESRAGERRGEMPESAHRFIAAQGAE